MGVEKPWGKYEDLYREDDVVLKKIIVDPKQRLSLQTHLQRAEFWVVTDGECLCELGPNIQRLKKWDTIHIEAGQPHRLINDTNDPCEVTELQFGLCTESDIIRYEDDYSRAEAPF
jgi:mannose-6-phosphate isomerase-like protein (cupin superfamily)